MIFALAMGLILLFIFMGVSIPLSFLSGSFFLAIFAGARTGSFATNAYYMLDSIAMLAIPLSVVGGQLVEKSGIANVLIEVGDRLLRKVKGGMAAAIPVVSCFFGAMCGSALATANTLATAMAPDMVKKGWDKRYVAALIAASSPMGFMIPPNVNAIVFSTAVSGASVGELFMSTIIPAIIWTGLYLLINRLIYTQYYDPTKRSDYVSEKVETGEATVMSFRDGGAEDGSLYTENRAQFWVKLLVAVGLAVLTLGGDIRRYLYRDRGRGHHVPLCYARRSFDLQEYQGVPAFRYFQKGCEGRVRFGRSFPHDDDLFSHFGTQPCPRDVFRACSQPYHE